MISRCRKTFLQFIKFGIVGVMNVGVNFVIYYILLFLGLHYIIANTIGYAVGIINSYYWNNRFVFNLKQDRHHLGKFMKICASYGITYIVSTFMLYILVTWLKISNIIAPMLILFITIPMNFTLNKFWVFKER